MNHSTETIAALHTNLAPLGWGRQPRARRMRRFEAPRSMRPVAIVVVDEEGEDVLEMLLVQDQHPIETLRTDSPYEALRPPRSLAVPETAYG